MPGSITANRKITLANITVGKNISEIFAGYLVVTGRNEK
jgi:hypothetical protein